MENYCGFIGAYCTTLGMPFNGIMMKYYYVLTGAVAIFKIKLKNNEQI